MLYSVAVTTIICFAVPGELDMMKPTVEKVLKDVQLLSKRMRTREAFADELLNSVGTLQTNLESMRAVSDSLIFQFLFSKSQSMCLVTNENSHPQGHQVGRVM